MKKLLLKYQEALLVMIVLAFLGIFIYFFDLTISGLGNDLNQIIQPINPSNSSIQFDIQGFKSIKLKGQ
jgi:hypothetical protein